MKTSESRHRYFWFHRRFTIRKLFPLIYRLYREDKLKEEFAVDGDGTNCTDWDEVALSWKFIDTISEVLEKEKVIYPHYKAGSMGLKVEDRMLAKDGFHS